MPLRAILNTKEVFSFNYTQADWDDLKLSYRKEQLLTHCCQTKAIPKKSKLGTFFFAHAKHGECTTAPETAQHIHLKSLIAKTALKSGWEVFTEHKGKTPTGEEWIADVFCKKGKAELAFEVQWSAQTNDEFKRRQQKYIESNIRCLWLYRLKGSKEYYYNDLLHEFETPVFGFRYDKSTSAITIPQFHLEVEPFIHGALNKRLRWIPKENEKLVAEVIPYYKKCWKCKKLSGYISGICSKTQDDIKISFHKFYDENVAELIVKNVPRETLTKHKIAEIKLRYSNTVKNSYLSLGCFYCDSINGAFFHSGEAIHNTNPDKKIATFNFTKDNSAPFFMQHWYFDKRESEAFF